MRRETTDARTNRITIEVDKIVEPDIPGRDKCPLGRLIALDDGNAYYFSPPGLGPEFKEQQEAVHALAELANRAQRGEVLGTEPESIAIQLQGIRATLLTNYTPEKVDALVRSEFVTLHTGIEVAYFLINGEPRFAVKASKGNR